MLSDDEIFKRVDFAYGVYKDRYVVISGGYRGRNILQSAAMYDVYTQNYLALPDLPYSGACVGVVLNDFFYVARRYDGIHRLCLSRPSKWELINNDMDFCIDEMVTDGTHIFFIVQGNTVYGYDPCTNQLHESSLTSMNKILTSMRQILTSSGQNLDSPPRDYFATAVVDHKIFVIGGQTIRGFVKSDMDVYDISTQSWSQAPPLPKPLDRAVATPIGKWIIVTGGHQFGNYNMNNQTFIYDTITQKWTEHSIVATSYRLCHGCVKVGNQIISIGGSNGQEFVCPMEGIHLKHVLPDWKWQIIQPFVFLRELVDQNRAMPIISRDSRSKFNVMIKHFASFGNILGKGDTIPTEKMKHDTDSKLDTDAVIRELFTDVSLDVFRHVMLFLV